MAASRHSVHEENDQREWPLYRLANHASSGELIDLVASKLVGSPNNPSLPQWWQLIEPTDDNNNNNDLPSAFGELIGSIKTKLR